MMWSDLQNEIHIFGFFHEISFKAMAGNTLIILIGYLKIYQPLFQTFINQNSAR